MFKFVVFAAVVAVARAGVISAPVYSHGYAPAASSHSSITQHTVSHAAPVAYAAAPAYHSYAAPAVTHYAQAPVAHYAQAPVAHYAAPIAKTIVSAPVAHYATKAVVAEQYSEPHYDFSYSVNDPHTGDAKEQQESRKGDAVHGFYSLIEADGTKRVVEYTADDHNGFNAVVHREGNAHPVAVKTVAPVYKAVAPVAVKYAAPAVAYQHAAPVATYASYANPAQYYHH